ncbi:TetR family transcriptional regulator [Nocardia jiangxiensis]|uniref:TetR family transcriptional regulator n=1 Tax=Nocardia jiangxiensis TaxID=282685 RepID=UPI000687FAE0|nr:TetR family transcriptional regulator [Nocardia jiangxiensis]
MGAEHAEAERAEADGRPAEQARDRIHRAVVELLEADGYDALQVREVARHARVSLTKIYKLYGTRDELICAALEVWMRENRYAGLSARAEGEESLYEGLMRVLRRIFEPWEQHPALLAAYFRARSAPGGDVLVRRGFEAVVPVAMAVLDGVDGDFVDDLDTIVSSLVYGLLGRFARGEIEVAQIVPALDRTVYWLTRGYLAERGR